MSAIPEHCHEIGLVIALLLLVDVLAKLALYGAINALREQTRHRETPLRERDHG